MPSAVIPTGRPPGPPWGSNARPANRSGRRLTYHGIPLRRFDSGRTIDNIDGSTAIVSIMEGMNPRMLEMKLRTFLFQEKEPAAREREQ